VFKWRCQTLFLPQEFVYKQFVGFWDRIREETGGRIDVTMYPDGALVDFADYLDALRGGVIELSLSHLVYYKDFFPAGAFGYQIPTFALGYFDAYTLYFNYGLWYLWERDLAEKSNGELLIFPGSYDEIMYASRKPVTSMADFKGLKLRAYGLAAEWFNRMGASAMQVSGSELYTSLSTGVLDAGSWGSFSAAADIHLEEVTDYYITPTWGGAFTMYYIASAAAFDSLPPDLRDYLELEMLKFSPIAIQEYWKDNLRALDEVWAKACTETYIPPEEQEKMNEIGWEVMDAYVKEENDPACYEAYEIVKDYLKDRKMATGR